MKPLVEFIQAHTWTTLLILWLAFSGMVLFFTRKRDAADKEAGVKWGNEE